MTGGHNGQNGGHNGGQLAGDAARPVLPLSISAGFTPDVPFGNICCSLWVRRDVEEYQPELLLEDDECAR